jgi:hypothetical protein
MKMTGGLLTAILTLTGTALLAVEPEAPGMGPDGHQPPPGMECRQPGGPGAGHAPGRGLMKERMPMPDRAQLEAAGVDAKQILALTTLRYDAGIRRVDLQAAVEKAEMTLELQMAAETVDPADVMNAVTALNQVRGELFKADIENQLKIREILGNAVMRKLQEQGPQGRRPPPPRAEATDDRPLAQPR